jgi:hypothetical protein
VPYLLTVSRLDLLTRRKRWSNPSYRSRIRVIGSPELPKGYPGLLVLVDDQGLVRHRLPMDNPKGLLVAGPGAPAVPDLAKLGVARVSLGASVAMAAYSVARRAADEALGAGTYTALAAATEALEIDRLLRAAPDMR